MPPGTPPPPPRRATDAEARSPIVWLLVLVPAAAVGYAAVHYVRNRYDPGVGVFPARVESVLPFLIFVALIGSMVKRPTRGDRMIWDAQPSLQRPRVLEADERSFVLTDAVARHEHRWESFTHVVETATQVLLFTGWYSFYFIPKRSFASTEELDAFRDLLRRQVVQRPAPAFPVLPARPV